MRNILSYGLEKFVGVYVFIFIHHKFSRHHFKKISQTLKYFLSFSSKIGLPQSSVLTNTSSENCVNCGEILFKSFKKEIWSAEQ